MSHYCAISQIVQRCCRQVGLLFLVKPHTNTSLFLFLVGLLQEQYHSEQIFSVAFSPFTDRTLDVFLFATCGDEFVTVYECNSKHKNGFKAIKTWRSKKENFYTVAWSLDLDTVNHSSLVLAAGLNGYVRVFDTTGKKKVGIMKGHSDAINDLKVCLVGRIGM